MNIWTILKSFLKINYRLGKKIFSSLKDECISEKYYLHVIDVWNVFKINILYY